LNAPTTDADTDINTNSVAHRGTDTNSIANTNANP
jgi:hypothetical protein